MGIFSSLIGRFLSHFIPIIGEQYKEMVESRLDMMKMGDLHGKGEGIIN
jgi:hypothetical protein